MQVRHTERTASKATTTHSHTAAAKELTEQIFGTNLIVEHATTLSPPRSTASRKGTRRTSTRTLKPAIRITTESIELGLLIRITQDCKGTSNHLESLVCAIVAVLVRMGEQAEFAVCFFDV